MTRLRRADKGVSKRPASQRLARCPSDEGGMKRVERRWPCPRPTEVAGDSLDDLGVRKGWKSRKEHRHGRSLVQHRRPEVLGVVDEPAQILAAHYARVVQGRL